MPDCAGTNTTQNYPAAPSPSHLLLQTLVDRRISVKEIAGAARVQPATIRVLLRGRARFSAHTAVRIALALGLEHHHFLLAQARHDTHKIARLLTPIEGPIRRAPVVCASSPPTDLSLRSLFTYELRRRRITTSLVARMAGLTWRTVNSLITSSAPYNNYAAVKLAQALELPLDHFAIAEAARRADLALNVLSALPEALAPRPARPGKGMTKSQIRTALIA